MKFIIDNQKLTLRKVPKRNVILALIADKTIEYSYDKNGVTKMSEIDHPKDEKIKALINQYYTPGEHYYRHRR